MVPWGISENKLLSLDVIYKENILTQLTICFAGFITRALFDPVNP
jgi:hypothetical protein